MPFSKSYRIDATKSNGYFHSTKQVRKTNSLKKKRSANETHGDVVASTWPCTKSTRPAIGPGVAVKYKIAAGSATVQYATACICINNEILSEYKKTRLPM